MNPTLNLLQGGLGPKTLKEKGRALLGRSQRRSSGDREAAAAGGRGYAGTRTCPSVARRGRGSSPGAARSGSRPRGVEKILPGSMRVSLWARGTLLSPHTSPPTLPRPEWRRPEAAPAGPQRPYLAGAHRFAEPGTTKVRRSRGVLCLEPRPLLRSPRPGRPGNRPACEGSASSSRRPAATCSHCSAAVLRLKVGVVRLRVPTPGTQRELRGSRGNVPGVSWTQEPPPSCPPQPPREDTDTPGPGEPRVCHLWVTGDSIGTRDHTSPSAKWWRARW